jgi:hypothetical protein
MGTRAKYEVPSSRSSKCPNFYTNRILGQHNLRQEMRTFCQNLNRDKMTYLIKYIFTSTVFNIPLVNTLCKITPRKATMGQLTRVLLFIELLPKKIRKIWTKKSIKDKTPYV